MYVQHGAGRSDGSIDGPVMTYNRTGELPESVRGMEFDATSPLDGFCHV
jgi:hypothetical protein